MEESEELPKIERVSWSEYGRVIDDLMAKLKLGPSFDVVVGVARGGLPLAVTASNQLGMPMQVIDITSYVTVGEQKIPSLRPSLLDVKGKKTLLVDDLVDTGDTMQMAVNHLVELGASTLFTAVLYHKPRSKFVPNLWSRQTNSWIVFPYETRID